MRGRVLASGMKVQNRGKAWSEGSRISHCTGGIGDSIHPCEIGRYRKICSSAGHAPAAAETPGQNLVAATIAPRERRLMWKQRLAALVRCECDVLWTSAIAPELASAPGPVGCHGCQRAVAETVRGASTRGSAKVAEAGSRAWTAHFVESARLTSAVR